MSLIIERVLDSFFEFQYDGNTFIDTAPSLSFENEYCHFKTKNGANIIKEQSIIATDITILDTHGGTGSYNPSNNLNLILKLVELNFFQDRVSSLTSGVTKFSQLLDGFSFYGNDGKVPVVDEDQLKLVARTFYNYNLLTQFDDVSIGDLTAGKYLKVENIDGQNKIVLADIDTSSIGTSLKKIIFIASEGDTEIPVDNSPNEVYVFKNTRWQTQVQQFEYTPGLISGLEGVIEGDYFEIIPLTNDVKKIPITVTIDGQEEFPYVGNTAFLDVFYKGRKLRDFEYAKMQDASGNRMKILSQYIKDEILTGDIIELIIY